MDECKEKERKIYKEIILDSIMALIPFAFVFILNLFFIGINMNFWILIEDRKGIFLEFIIIYSVAMLLLGILKKGKRMIIVLGTIILLLSIINQLKYAFTGEPILLTDILFLGSSGEIVDIIKEELGSTINLFIVPLIIEIILFIIVIMIGKKLYSKIEINNIKQRISLIVIPIVILAMLFLPIKTTNSFMLNVIFDINNRKDYDSFVTIAEYYLTYGVLGGMHGQLLENRIQEPKDYNEENINKELSETNENSNKILGNPNIIVVFSESFWDVDQLEEVEFNQKVTPNFNALKDKGLFFNMISPSYGGVSANVEYEFLTGSNVMYFNRGYIPYMQLYKNNKYYRKPSIISELKNNGYKTKIVTCASPSLFNCGKFYQYLNIDETEYISKVEDKYIKGKYVSDEYVTDKIIKEFNNKEKDKKMFYMTLTMQAHMPYAKEKYSNYDVWVTKSNFSQKVNDTLTSYAQGIYDADKQLGRLYEYIQTLEEPTIIVFYGDHLPYLYYGKDNAIDKLEYFNTDNQTLNNYRKYNTQSLILSNFEIKKDEEETQYLGPDLLGTYILNNMDIKISDYYKWLYETRKTIGAANFFVTVDRNGNLYNTYELNGEYKDIYNMRRNIEYKLFVK